MVAYLASQAPRKRLEREPRIETSDRVRASPEPKPTSTRPKIAAHRPNSSAKKYRREPIRLMVREDSNAKAYDVFSATQPPRREEARRPTLNKATVVPM